MKKIELGQTITILANVGVIAGIVFLAVELRQNNELLAAEARANQFFQARMPTIEQLNTNPELTQILYKIENRETVSPEELYQFRWFARGLFIRWQWQFGEYEQGFIDKERLPLSSWRSWFRQYPEILNEWEAAAGLTPEFEQFIEEEVIGVQL